MNSKRIRSAAIRAGLGALSALALIGCATSRESTPPTVPVTAPVAPSNPAPDPPATAAAASPAAAGAPAEAATTDYKNTVRWSTASEVDNFGYDVYRADSADGPWKRINASPILGAGTTDEVQKYSYVDRDIEPTRAYFYYVESISLGGVREKFTPVIAAKAKLPASPGP